MLESLHVLDQLSESCCSSGSLAASFSEAKALLVGGMNFAKENKDDNAVARNHARASHELRASLNLERNRPSMDQVLTENICGVSAAGSGNNPYCFLVSEECTKTNAKTSTSPVLTCNLMIPFAVDVYCCHLQRLIATSACCLLLLRSMPQCWSDIYCASCRYERVLWKGQKV